MAIDFPTSPTTGQQYTFGGTTYTFTAQGVWSPIGAVAGVSPPQGRLTLTTLTPVMVANVSGAATVYYTPYNGNIIPIFNGSAFVMTVFSELLVATTNTTKNPAAIGINKVNDWFVWNDAGTIRISHGPDWTSDIARSAGTALVMVNGILLNNASITNGPAAQRGTYVGTTRSNGSSTIDWTVLGRGLGGVPAFLGIWNCYNRVGNGFIVMDTNGSWSYGGVFRSSDNSVGNRVSYVAGLNEDCFDVSLIQQVYSGLSSDVSISIGLDTTSSVSGNCPVTYGGNTPMSHSIRYIDHTGIGFHFLQALEGCITPTNPATFFGQVSGIQAQSFTGTIMG